MINFEMKRQHMVDSQIVARGVRDIKVINAMSLVPPREICSNAFTPPGIL